MRIEHAQAATVLRELGVDYRPGERLADWTSLGVGGTTDLLIVEEPQRLPELIAWLRQEGIPWRLLGGGTNVLVAEGELPEVILHLSTRQAGARFDGERVEVEAAADLGRTVTECARRNLGGMEGLIGVPGTVGGALRMNAGAYGTEIGQFVRSVTVFRAAEQRIETLGAEEISFDYRHTSFAPEDIMLGCELRLPPRPYEEIRAAIKMCNEKRRASQPLNQKSAGCIFKNPSGGSVGKMIDELGLKGHRRGGAVVSEQHANFFVNRYDATADDFFALIEDVRQRIQQAFSVELENEVIVWAQKQ
ncbi:MAG: UDP-N-acetylmuramate dehydrogenase [Acidobacteria bacterium]|nr:UDP-N-acetylmuramate dehydrogenase [Acidobacteriota bacterium]